MLLADQLQGPRRVTAGGCPRQEVPQLRLHPAQGSRGRTGPGETGLREEVLALEEGQITTVAVDGGQRVKTPATGEVKADGGTVTRCHLTSDGEDGCVQSEAAEADTDRLAQQPGGHPSPPAHVLADPGLQSASEPLQPRLSRSTLGAVQFIITERIFQNSLLLLL